MNALNVKRIDDERGEVWRTDLPPHQVSIEAIFLAVRQLCSFEVYDRFYKGCPVIGGTTMREDAKVDRIANGLGIAGKR